MQFLKTLLWVMLAVVIVLFAANNWTPVSIDLGPQLRLDTTLAAIVVAALLIGFVPLYFFHRAHVWRLRRRIASLESRLAPPPPPAPAPVAPASDPLAPSPVPPAAPARDG
jgi:uncharacterized integral membrane protein